MFLPWSHKVGGVVLLLPFSNLKTKEHRRASEVLQELGSCVWVCVKEDLPGGEDTFQQWHLQ